MKLLNDLLTLNEGSMKNAIMDLIEKAMSSVELDSKSLEKDAKIIAAEVRKIDSGELVGGMGDEELIAMIKPMLDKADYAVNEADEVEVEMQILSKASGDRGVKYSVVLDPSTEQVQLVDNTGKVYIQVPLVIWQQLSRNQG